MENIKDKVAIIGAGCTKFGELWSKSREDLIFEACREAIEDAGIEAKDIQAAWMGTQESARSGQVLSHALKLDYIPVTHIENQCATGQDTLRNAAFAVAGGFYDMVLVCGFEKLKDYGVPGLPNPDVNPGESPSSITPTSLGVQFPTCFATAAQRYFYTYGIDPHVGKELLAKIAVKNHYNGSLHPKAHLQKAVTIEQVMNAPLIAKPLGLFDCCGVSDGAAAAILTRPEIAKKLKSDYILLKGIGLSCGFVEFTIQDTFDYVHFEETVRAARTAYEQAGIKNPREEIDLAEVHDCFTITEMILYEDLGFSPRGKAKEDIESGFFSLNGGLPVNPDGGLKSFGHPIGASGLRMLYEVYNQLLGRAGQRQLKKADIGMIQGQGGHPLNSFASCAAIFGRGD